MNRRTFLPILAAALLALAPTAAIANRYAPPLVERPILAAPPAPEQPITTLILARDHALMGPRTSAQMTAWEFVRSQFSILVLFWR